MKALSDLGKSRLRELCAEARGLRDLGKGRTISFSSKVFIPLTRLCSNQCAYCGYRLVPGNTGGRFFLTPEEAMGIVREGERAGCVEALLVTGERPESRHREAGAWLRGRGCSSTPEYVGEICRLILDESTLLPHTNCGLLDPGELRELADVNASMGLMLESSSRRLCEPGGPHEQSPAKAPDMRLRMLEDAGRLGVPMTTGLLIGIGETDDERLESLHTLRALQEQYGHIQEVIIQNFRPIQSTRMAGVPAADRVDLVWTAAAARILLGAEMNLQIPPNLALKLGEPLAVFLDAGVNDWGGVSPVTSDLVNTGAEWPDLGWLETNTREAGFNLRKRFPVYPEVIIQERLRLSPLVRQRLETRVDADGYVVA